MRVELVDSTDNNVQKLILSGVLAIIRKYED